MDPDNDGRLHMEPRPKVFICRTFPPAIVEPLARIAEVGSWPGDGAVPPDELIRGVQGCRAVITTLTEPVGPDLLAEAEDLAVISQMAAGYDNIDLEAARSRGIVVTNTPGVTTEATADVAWLLILMVARQAPVARSDLLEGRWRSWEVWRWAGKDLAGATLGVVGLGKIGAAVAARARGFGMQVVYHSRRRDPAAEERTGAQYCETLQDLLTVADVVSLHVPLSPATRHLIGQREFEAMREGAILINTARGGVVDEAALLAALDNGRLMGAGLDVFAQEPLDPASPLLRQPRIVALPHIGSATVRTRTAMARMAVENAIAVLTGQPEKAHRVI